MTEPASEKPSTARIGYADEQVALVYAKALVGATENAGQTDAVLDEFDALVVVFEQFPDLGKVLVSPLVSREEKAAIIDRIVGGRVLPLLVDFLKVVANHGRLGVIRAIQVAARDLFDERAGRVRVQVTTAVPLASASGESLKKMVRRLVGGEPQFETTVDPNLIGGVMLRVGDTVYDGSVARQLEQLRGQIINRSVHEIQSRRDRFRHSGGN